MPREKEGYIEQLSDILLYFKERRLLTVTDVGQYLGIDWNTAKKRFNIDGKKGITATELARKLIS